MTVKQLNKLHTEKYVMVTFEFGEPIYLMPITGLSIKDIRFTPLKEEAEIWSYADTLSVKLDYYKAATGYRNLEFIKL